MNYLNFSKQDATNSVNKSSSQDLLSEFVS